MGLKYAILGLLHYSDMHGYRIKEHIEKNFGHMWTINYGQIYPNLKSMLADGLITMQEVNCEGEKGPPRKLYSITEEGRQEFQKWLRDNPERNMLLRDPFLMRFVFFGFSDTSNALEKIEDQILLWEEQLEKREQNMHRWSREGIYVQLMAELGFEMNKTFLKWLKKARTQIMEQENTVSVSQKAGK